MHYVRHYYHLGSKDPDFKDFLEKQFRIPCTKESITTDGTRFRYVFDVPENHSQFSALEPFLPKPTDVNSKPWLDKDPELVQVMYIPKYTTQEMFEARWLSVRSCFSKVYPENISDVEKRVCLSRVTAGGFNIMRHSYHIGNYVVKTPVKWGKRFFASAAYVSEYELFCNREARNAMETAGLSGVEYESVRRKSTGEPIEDIYRLNVSNTLPDGAIVPVSDMDTYVCDQCGMHMLGFRNTRGQFGIRADSIDDSLDFYNTLPLFTPDATESSPANGHSKLIVSQRFYRLVKERKMDRALIFEPINVV